MKPKTKCVGLLPFGFIQCDWGINTLSRCRAKAKWIGQTPVTRAWCESHKPTDKVSSGGEKERA